MSLSITQPLKKAPAFPELLALAGQHNVRINGNEAAGDFWYPDGDQLKVTGHYAVDGAGNIRGDFTARIMGKTAGTFAITAEMVEITITEKPFLLPESLLKTMLSAALNNFCMQLSVSP